MNIHTGLYIKAGNNFIPCIDGYKYYEPLYRFNGERFEEVKHVQAK